jgi:hypothetical protein
MALGEVLARYCRHPPMLYQAAVGQVHSWGEGIRNPERRKRAHVHELEALGYKVALEPAV